jgi:hypothetical protein
MGRKVEDEEEDTLCREVTLCGAGEMIKGA